MVTILKSSEITSDNAPLFENHSVSRKSLRDPGKKFVRVDTVVPTRRKMISFACDVVYMTYKGAGKLIFTKHPSVRPEVAEVTTEMIILVTAATMHRFESSATTNIIATRTELLPEGEHLRKTTHFVLETSSSTPSFL